MTASTLETRIRVPLLILRVTLGIFLLQWGVEKLVWPDVTAKIFSHFYFIDGLGLTAAYVMGVLQILLSLAIIFGAFRGISYLIGFIIHGLSTVSTAKHIFMPFMFEGWNHLFMTAVPVLAGFWLLYWVRDWDTLSVDGMRKKES